MAAVCVTGAVVVSVPLPEVGAAGADVEAVVEAGAEVDEVEAAGAGDVGAAVAEVVVAGAEATGWVTGAAACVAV